MQSLVLDYRSIGAEFAAHLPRLRFELSIALGGITAPFRLVDLGSGLNLFAAAASRLGGEVLIVDDFGDGPPTEWDKRVAALHEEIGVQIVRRDLREGIADLGAFDVVTCMSSMEHWHHSPRQLFQQVAAQLRDGGRFVLSGPNCVNLRKRITVPFGVGAWTPLNQWYDVDTFRGHVREPALADLVTIMNGIGLRDVRTYGRNWLGHSSPSALTRAATAIGDHVLRLRPSLCSDIYAVGRR